MPIKKPLPRIVIPENISIGSKCLGLSSIFARIVK